MSNGRSIACASAALLCIGAMAEAGEVELPGTMAWTAYDVGSAGHSQAVAIAQALNEAYGVTLRIVPAANDVSRLAPLRDGRIPFSAAGSDLFFASEGALGFAAADWGPQPVRLLSSASADNCLAMGTAAEANIESVADLEGRRVAWILGAPGLQTNVRAFLAFGGLTTDDVELVEVSGYVPAWQALINDQVDATTGLTTGGVIEQAAASPRGLRWLEMPHDDEDAWARLHQVAPHMVRRTAIVGANVSEEDPLECMAAPYPILVTYADQNRDLVYNLTKAVSEQVDRFAAAEPGAAGWADDRQNFTWVVPFHEGAIRYWEEQGLWTEEAEAHNAQLLERQEVLAEAWAQMEGASDDEVSERWMQVRAEALRSAGLPVYFEDE